MSGSEVRMWLSTFMEPFSPSSSPAAFARSDSGTTPTASTTKPHFIGSRSFTWTMMPPSVSS